ncbi:MAG: hypothetical protein SWY16_01945 [Cyanobacteriota bacterium]|nr:hypothetical protein [Cyanobacteriota bacterium]
MRSETVRYLRYIIGGMSVPILATLFWLAPVRAVQKPALLAQSPEAGESVEIEEDLEIIELDDMPESLDPDVELSPDEMRPLSLDSSVLSLPGAQRLIEEAKAAVSQQDYELAAQKLQEARQILNQLSTYYQELAASFSGIDNRIFENQRDMALEAAQLRDRATYELAVLRRAQNKPELAVPLLVQIIRSQNPTRDLGQDAYRQLFELGFVDAPYPRPRNAQSSN